MNIGVDIVLISRIERILQEPDATHKLFSPKEINDNVESLAGILATKEAYMKACGQKLDWLSIEVKKNNSGKPYIANNPNASVSISHDGGYAVAVVLLTEQK